MYESAGKGGSCHNTRKLVLLSTGVGEIGIRTKMRGKKLRKVVNVPGGGTFSSNGGGANRGGKKKAPGGRKRRNGEKKRELRCPPG